MISNKSNIVVVKHLKEYDEYCFYMLEFIVCWTI